MVSTFSLCGVGVQSAYYYQPRSLYILPEAESRDPVFERNISFFLTYHMHFPGNGIVILFPQQESENKASQAERGGRWGKKAKKSAITADLGPRRCWAASHYCLEASWVMR